MEPNIFSSVIILAVGVYILHTGIQRLKNTSTALKKGREFQKRFMNKIFGEKLGRHLYEFNLYKDDSNADTFRMTGAIYVVIGLIFIVAALRPF